MTRLGLTRRCFGKPKAAKEQALPSSRHSAAGCTERNTSSAVKSINSTRTLSVSSSIGSKTVSAVKHAHLPLLRPLPQRQLRQWVCLRSRGLAASRWPLPPPVLAGHRRRLSCHPLLLHRRRLRCRHLRHPLLGTAAEDAVCVTGKEATSVISSFRQCQGRQAHRQSGHNAGEELQATSNSQVTAGSPAASASA